MHRRVRRLRLACVHEDHARHGRVLLEDALRTATLGDERRLIIVRRLDLGRMPLRASSTQWSRRIEDLFRRAQTAPVHFDALAAPYADAIYFNDRTEPWLALAQRTALRQSIREWFWRAALPGWDPRNPPAETLRLCVRALAWQGGLRLTLQLARHLRTVDALDPLLAALQVDDLAAAANELGSSGAAVMDARPSEPPRSFAAPLTSAETAAIQAWGAPDLRTRWFAAVHLAHGSLSPALGTNALPSSRALDRLLAEWCAPSAYSSRRSAPPPTFTKRSETPAHSPAPAPRPLGERPRRPVIDSDRDFTRAGGLFFAWPLLTRAGLPAYVARQNAMPAEEVSQLPWQVLRLVLRHARAPETDPLVVALRDLPPAQLPLGRWLIAANRHALHLAQLNVRQLVTRPALVTLSPTNIDVFFRPGDADIRIRRAALDLDPGWVPWLGRAIAYHFSRED